MEERRVTRRTKVTTLLHRAGVEGLTCREIAQRLELRPYEVQQVLSSELKRRKATIVGGRRRGPSDDHLDDIYACRCPLIAEHHPRPVDDEDDPTHQEWRLDDATRDRGRAGLAEARAALAAAKDRRSA